MAISIETLALAIAWVKKHGGGGGGVDPDTLGDLAYKNAASATYKPAGSVSKPEITATLTKTDVSKAELKTTVTKKNLKIEFDRGELPAKVVTDVSAELDAAPTFDGTEATITAK